MKAEDFGYVVKNNLCLFQKGPFSQWYGVWDEQNGGFTVDIDEFFSSDSVSINYVEAMEDLKGLFYDGTIRFNCCEQWMMAKKAVLFRDFQTFKKIMLTVHPKDQKALGREVRNFNQAFWNVKKYGVVVMGNLYKFAQNEDVREFLLSFHRQTVFAEAAPWDKIWGIGLAPDNPKAWDLNTWEGENLLGMAVSEVRRSFE